MENIYKKEHTFVLTVKLFSTWCDIYKYMQSKKRESNTCILTLRTSRGVIAKWVIPALNIPPRAQTPIIPCCIFLTNFFGTPDFQFSIHGTTAIFIYYRLVVICMNPFQEASQILVLKKAIRFYNPIQFNWLGKFSTPSIKIKLIIQSNLIQSNRFGSV